MHRLDTGSVKPATIFGQHTGEKTPEHTNKLAICATLYPAVSDLELGSLAGFCVYSAQPVLRMAGFAAETWSGLLVDLTLVIW
jgi:hypothetical protein